jgi:signal transduction histidine kinase
MEFRLSHHASERLMSTAFPGRLENTSQKKKISQLKYYKEHKAPRQAMIRLPSGRMSGCAMPMLGQALPLFRRVLLLYLLAIVVPTLVLLYLGLQAVRRQREAIGSLSVSNLRLSGERLAAELERRTSQLAEAALHDPEIARLPLPADGRFTPEATARIRSGFDSIQARHQIARHFFLLQGNAVRFPLVRTPPPQPLQAGSRTNSSVAQRFVQLFFEAEDQELRQQRPDLALEGYRQSYQLAVSGPWKAQALERVARCLQKTNQDVKAQEAYRTLLDHYGNLYDPFFRPYALIAILELKAPELVPELRRELLRGQWELSAEQVDYFLERLTAQSNAPPETSESEFLAHLRLAQALEEKFQHQGPLRAGEVYALAFTRGPASYQTYYTPWPTPGEPETLVGLSVNLKWVQQQLLPQLLASLGISQEARLVPSGSKDRAAQDRGVVRVAFKGAFPFWELAIAPAGGAGLAATSRDTLIFALSTALVLSVLVLSILLLIRDVFRQIEMGRLRADFVSGISHELKTPLTLIRLYGETLLEGGDFPEPERRSYYQVITRESERLTRLIEKVLDFSRIDRDKKQYHLQEGDLAATIIDAVHIYGEYLKRRGFFIETDFAPRLPPARFDPEAVSQAVLNLLDNAAKYSAESKFVGVRLLAREDRVTVEVEDHGIGIPASERAKLFEQFYRAPGAAGQGGYGLGLYLVKHIMDAHGGSVEVESEAGRGSRFRLNFPCIKS